MVDREHQSDSGLDSRSPVVVEHDVASTQREGARSAATRTKIFRIMRKAQRISSGYSNGFTCVQAQAIHVSKILTKVKWHIRPSMATSATTRRVTVLPGRCCAFPSVFLVIFVARVSDLAPSLYQVSTPYLTRPRRRLHRRVVGAPVNAEQHRTRMASTSTQKHSFVLPSYPNLACCSIAVVQSVPYWPASPFPAPLRPVLAV